MTHSERIMKLIYGLFCKVGLHQWVEGEGWIEIAPGVTTYHKGKRCIWCPKAIPEISGVLK